MTSNNLRSHIAWLLSAKPFIPPPTYLNTPIDQLPPSSSALGGGSFSNEADAVAVNDGPRRDEGTQPQPAILPSARPSLLSTYNNAVGTSTVAGAVQERRNSLEDNPSDMARLRAGPSSAAKPRLVMQDELSRSGRATKSPEKYQGFQLGNTGAVIDSGYGRTPRSAVPHITEQRSTTRPTPKMVALDTIDALDLTGESDSREQSSPTFRIPAAKPRKRKSEEFEEDSEPEAGPVERSPTRHNVATAASFVSIDDFEDPPPPYSTAIGNRGPILRTDGQVRRNDRIADRSTPVLGVPESEPEASGSRKRKPLGRVPSSQVDYSKDAPFQIPCSPEKVLRSGQSKSRNAGATSPVKPPSTKKLVVADSEDEEYDDDFDAPAKKSPTKSPVKIEQPSSGDEMVIDPAPQHSRREASVEKSKDFRWHGWKDGAAVSPSKAGVLVYDAVPIQPSVNSEARKARSVSPKKESQPTAMNTGTQQASPSPITEEERASVTAFLAWPESQLEAHQDSMKLQIKSMSAELVNRLGEDNDMALELQAELIALKEQSKATESLKRISEDCRHERARKEKLKARLMIFFEDGLDGEAYQPLFHENQVITQNLKQLEVEIVQSLKDCRLLDDEGKLICVAGSAPGNPEVMIRSTQATPFKEPAPEAYVPDSTGIARTQFVQQTQYTKRAPTTPSKRQNDLASSKRSKNVAFDLHDTEIEYEASNRMMDGDIWVDPDEIDDIDENDEAALLEAEGAFHGNGEGLAAHQTGDSDDDDEFGDIPEDAFEDVSENVENPSPVRPHRFESGSRNAFTEISGNQNRMLSERMGPPAQKQSTNAQTSMPPPAALMQYPWSREVKARLKDHFKLKGFRPHQAEAINATLGGKDCFVLMPTGGGKSLCYQLPSVIRSGKTQGVTIVISPLLSLMEDQVDHLRKLNIQAFYINGEIGAEQRRHILGGLREPQVEKFVQLLYVTPEMLSKNQSMVNALVDLYHRQRLARIVIDEAHCVSQWGHDFRPDYKALGQIREQFQGVPVMALTATATENVKVDVMHNLGIDGCEVFVQSFNRPNLHYEVRRKGKDLEVLDCIAKTIKDSYENQSGIVYCLSRKKCEKLADQLSNEHGIKAHHYHAGMDPADKSRVQKMWQAGRYHVIVATIAFGMGIDKPDVRFVIHHSVPKSLEGYYQETGRAGRDGKRSGCILYYGYQDTNALKRMIDEGDGSWQQKERQRDMLRNVVMFCENRSDCRRVQVLAYFNESFQSSDCRAACDNCNSTTTFVNRDFTEYAKLAIRLVKRIEARSVTLLQFVDVFCGRNSKKVKEGRYEELPEFGAGSELELGHVERLFYRLMSENALREENVANRKGFAIQYIKSSAQSNLFLFGGRRLELNVPVSPKGKSKKAVAAPRKKQRTGVAAATRDEYPQSTNVSSPVQAISRRRKAKAPVDDDDEDEGYHDNGYHRDGGFVVNDREDADEDSEGFEPIRQGSPRKRVPARVELGPPITIDQKMADLNETHRIVVDEFVENGREICKRIKNAKNMRDTPFSDTILREMAISFPKTKAAMNRIPGIKPAMVSKYGDHLSDLIAKSEDFYNSAMRAEDSQRVPLDPNREIIELSDDDDNEEYGEPMAVEDFEEDPSQDVRSSYFAGFRQDDEVAAFNAVMSQAERAPTISRPARESAGNEAKANGGRKRGSKPGGNGYAKGRSAGVTKKSTGRSRGSGGASGYSAGTSKGPRRGGGGAGLAGIGMMPT